MVKFQGSDDTTLTSDDRAKYTLEFRTDGSLLARVDCNRGRGTWNAPGSNELQLGELALTKMACPPGTLLDRFARDLGYVRTYTMKDGHLYLALMMDGGIYEFEPLPD
ncbi:MAG: META domain-containing protein [Gemmatimonadota bacterium]